jgi:hypothetical protein
MNSLFIRKRYNSRKSVCQSEGSGLEKLPSVDDVGNQDALGFPVVPIGLSAYLSKACYKGNLFDQTTYSIEKFESYMDEFCASTISTIKLPTTFNLEATLKRFQDQVRAGTSEFKKMLESTDADDLESVRKTVKKVQSQGGSGFDKLITYIREGDFPLILWIELSRAKLTFLDTLEYLTERMDKIFNQAPKLPSQVRQRNKLAQRMGSASSFTQVFIEFSKAFSQLYRLLLFIEIWSCDNESQLFTHRPWRFHGVDESAFDEVFVSLHASISSLRQAYFSASGEKREQIEGDDPIPWAIRELVRLA